MNRGNKSAPCPGRQVSASGGIHRGVGQRAVDALPVESVAGFGEADRGATVVDSSPRGASRSPRRIWNTWRVEAPLTSAPALPAAEQHAELAPAPLVGRLRRRRSQNRPRTRPCGSTSAGSARALITCGQPTLAVSGSPGAPTSTLRRRSAARQALPVQSRRASAPADPASGSRRRFAPPSSPDRSSPPSTTSCTRPTRTRRRRRRRGRDRSGGISRWSNTVPRVRASPGQ